MPIGSQPLWRSLFDHAKVLPHGALITYEKISELLERDVLQDRSPVYQAIKHLEATEQRTLVCVTLEGYRVAEPADHLGLAKKRKLRSQRQIRKGLSTLRATDRSKVDSETSKRLDDLEVVMSRVNQLLRYTQAKVEKLESKQTSDMRDVGEQLADIRKALSEAGIKT
jgi:hypothetical protein